MWYSTDGMVYAMVGYGIGLVWYPFYYSIVLIVWYCIVWVWYVMVGMVGYGIV